MKLSNEDRWLIKRWNKVKELQDAMNSARNHFINLHEEVHKNLKELCPALNRMDIHWGPSEIENYGGNVVFSKSSWPSELENWRRGIYIERTSLDELCSESISQPDIYIYFQAKKNDPRIEKFRERIAKDATKNLKNKVQKWLTIDESDSRTLLWYVFPERKDKLLEMILDGREQEFVNCMVKHIGIMAGLMPTLDELFSKR